jgi:hypothetical protein
VFTIVTQTLRLLWASTVSAGGGRSGSGTMRLSQEIGEREVNTPECYSGDRVSPAMVTQPHAPGARKRSWLLSSRPLPDRLG